MAATHQAVDQISPGAIVVKVLAEPSLHLGNAHSLAMVIVDDLILVDFTEAEISRIGVREI
jgi:hypothetical protein